MSANTPTVEGTSRGTLLVVDGHSLAFRAFFALPVENFSTSSGQATNAVWGFATMLSQVIDAEHPDHLAVAFDVKAVSYTHLAKILELDKNRNNVVLSRRQYLEETQSEVRETFLSQLKKGQIREGVVSSIVNFGAFVDLGGVDGLIHVSELSWKHIDHPSEVVKVGDKVTVEVLDVDLDRERISLSLKATQEDPWQRFARTHVPGQIVKGLSLIHI